MAGGAEAGAVLLSDGGRNFSHPVVLAQAFDVGGAPSPSACAAVIKDRSPDMERLKLIAFSHGVCRVPWNARAEFDLALGDTFLNKYQDRDRALSSYQDAANEGSTEAQSRIAALNAPLPGQLSNSAPSDEDMPPVCLNAANAPDHAEEGTRDHEIMGGCIVAMGLCMIEKFKGSAAVRRCVADALAGTAQTDSTGRR
jgi:hypothetical protein